MNVVVEIHLFLFLKNKTLSCKIRISHKLPHFIQCWDSLFIFNKPCHNHTIIDQYQMLINQHKWMLLSRYTSSYFWNFLKNNVKSKNHQPIRYENLQLNFSRVNHIRFIMFQYIMKNIHSNVIVGIGESFWNCRQSDSKRLSQENRIWNIDNSALNNIAVESSNMCCFHF